MSLSFIDWAQIPLLVISALIISFLSSLGGVSGAFMLLPFQISFLGLASPSASATNLLFNLIAIPGGVVRFYRRKSICWAIVATLLLGGGPGIVVGFYLRVLALPDPRVFKLFAGGFLFTVAVVLSASALIGQASPAKAGSCSSSFPLVEEKRPGNENREIDTVNWTWSQVVIRQGANHFSYRTVPLVVLAFVVGIASGAYGIGGGSVLAPLLIVFFALPVSAIVGAALTATYMMSLLGVAAYVFLGRSFEHSGTVVLPNWFQGCCLGIGGFGGMWLSSRFHDQFPERIIKLILSLMMAIVAIFYFVGNR